MPISESLYELIRGLSLADLLELGAYIPILIRARLAGIHLNFADIQNSTVGRLHREAVRTDRLQAPIPVPPAPVNPTAIGRATRDSTASGPTGATADGLRNYHRARDLAAAFRRFDSSSRSRSRSS